MDHGRIAPPLLILLLLLVTAGCSPDVTVSLEGTPSVSASAVATGIAPLLGLRVAAGPTVAAGWTTCTTSGGSHAIRAASTPRAARPTVIVTSLPVAVDQPDAPCTRVFGAAPPGTNTVLVSDREVRGRCSSMPHADAVVAVAAHELGHLLELTEPGEGIDCDARGCHCTDDTCLMNDDRGGCPQPDEALCARCRR